VARRPLASGRAHRGVGQLLCEAVRPADLHRRRGDIAEEAVLDEIVVRSVGQVQSIGPKVRELAAVERNPGRVRHPDVALDPLIEVGRVDWAKESRASSAAALILDKTLRGEPCRVLE